MSKTYTIIFVLLLLLAFLSAAVCLVYFCFKMSVIAGILALCAVLAFSAGFVAFYVKKRKYYNDLANKK